MIFLTHQAFRTSDRLNIGLYLTELGDSRPGVGLRKDGLPDIVWCKVPKGKITLDEKKGTFRVDAFHIAKYPVTYIQYRSFLAAEDGYRKKGWWEGLAGREDQPGEQFRKFDNHPAEYVSWYDAVAFCRWLTEKLGYEVRLPTEWEWQQAATGGRSCQRIPVGSGVGFKQGQHIGKRPKPHHCGGHVPAGRLTGWGAGHERQCLGVVP